MIPSRTQGCDIPTECHDTRLSSFSGETHPTPCRRRGVHGTRLAPSMFLRCGQAGPTAHRLAAAGRRDGPSGGTARAPGRSRRHLASPPGLSTPAPARRGTPNRPLGPHRGVEPSRSVPSRAGGCSRRYLPRSRRTSPTPSPSWRPPA